VTRGYEGIAAAHAQGMIGTPLYLSITIGIRDGIALEENSHGIGALQENKTYSRILLLSLFSGNQKSLAAAHEGHFPAERGAVTSGDGPANCLARKWAIG